ncbi:MAG: CHC2 zinc finger domain-containing protein, partial [Planctomycetota bacterium]
MPLSASSPTPRDDVKERVREAVDIVDVVGSYVTLRRQGKAMTGLCPWHEDSRPSLQVNPERQTYRCWVCDVGGDVFSFVMRMEKVEFREALEQLADRAGITLPRQRGARNAPGRAERRADRPYAVLSLIHIGRWRRLER